MVEINDVEMSEESVVKPGSSGRLEKRLADLSLHVIFDVTQSGQMASGC